MKLRQTLLALPFLLTVAGSVNAGSNTIVENFIEAFNQHDVDAMLALATDDIRWMSVSGDQVSVETGSADALSEAMVGYFASTPGVRAEIRSISTSGPFVHTVEEAFWTVEGKERSQCALAVYELASGKVKSVWHFPAHACAEQAAAKSDYQGQESREIKALSEQEVSAYLGGNGMGYAKAAELNHYPGPRHVLDLADELELSTEQATQIQAIFEDMNAKAVSMGEEIVDREAALDKLFAGGSIDAQSLDALVSEIAELNGQLRYVHLAAHLETRALLTQRQVQHYDALRGYGGSHGKNHQHDH